MKLTASLFLLSTLPIVIVTSFLPAIYYRLILQPTTAIAVYSAQIQVSAVFIAILPIFYVFYQTRSEIDLKQITMLAVLEVVTSLVGMAFSIAFLIAGRFEIYFVLLPFGFIGFTTFGLVWFLMIAGGLLNFLGEVEPSENATQ